VAVAAVEAAAAAAAAVEAAAAAAAAAAATGPFLGGTCGGTTFCGSGKYLGSASAAPLSKFNNGAPIAQKLIWLDTA
jgi:hypothetical protein